MKYVTKGVCSKEIQFELVEGKVHNVKFIGGCPGNLSAISALVEGMPAEEIIGKFQGNICRNNTSCADQLARALQAQLR